LFFKKRGRFLFLANYFGFKVKEVPVEWKNDPETKVKFPNAIFSSLYDLIKIRDNASRKIYK